MTGPESLVGTGPHVLRTGPQPFGPVPLPGLLRAVPLPGSGTRRARGWRRGVPGSTVVAREPFPAGPGTIGEPFPGIGTGR
ncbi:hypothetical protein, partial [Streptomyces achromogenes]|uniref:hypothetical protein n=1 Tax=Streptomyces achromogenes TaxID=67255 RepID=UPI00370114B5